MIIRCKRSLSAAVVEDLKMTGLLLVTRMGLVSPQKHWEVGGKRDQKERSRRVMLLWLLLETVVTKRRDVWINPCANIFPGTGPLGGG